jgi:hypothetical protein
VRSHEARADTQEERERIDHAIAAGDRIRATSMYISITECGLTDVQEFIKALTTELQLQNPEKFAKKNKRDIEFDPNSAVLRASDTQSLVSM